MTESPIQRHNRLLCARLLREHRAGLTSKAVLAQLDAELQTMLKAKRVTVGVGYGNNSKNVG